MPSMLQALKYIMITERSVPPRPLSMIKKLSRNELLSSKYNTKKIETLHNSDEVQKGIVVTMGYISIHDMKVVKSPEGVVTPIEE